jgi:hypothetical protein
VTLAAEAIVMAGAAVLSMPVFMNALSWILVKYHTFAALRENISFKVLNQARTVGFCTPPSSLNTLCILTRSKVCLDPRDRVYAILSLLPSELSAGIVPDYTRALEQIFKDTVLHYINEDQRLDFLALCRFRDPDSVLPLPTWVFDFSVPYQFSIELGTYNASGRSRSEIAYDSLDDSLTIRGRQICVIDQVFEAIPIGAELPEILTICQAWETAGASTTPLVGGVPWSEAFIATIFSSQINDCIWIHQEVLDAQKLRKAYMSSCERGIFPASDRGSREFLAPHSLPGDLSGRRLFMAHSGIVGLCPAWASEGDTIIAALGCGSPLVLRSTGGNQYQVGGECFVNGMMYGEAMMGPFSPGSRPAWEIVNGVNREVVIDSDGISTQFDPRAGPLPPGWSVHYGWSARESGPEILDGKLQRQSFYHADKEEWTLFDPRLTSENLRSMGVDIQEFVLV